MEISRSGLNFFGPFSIRCNFLNESWFSLITFPQIKMSSLYSYLWKLQGNLQQCPSSQSLINLESGLGYCPSILAWTCRVQLYLSSQSLNLYLKKSKKLQCHQDDDNLQQFISPSFSPRILELSVSQHSGVQLCREWGWNQVFSTQREQWS